MSTTEFAMVEELASLVKDNLPCKHLILSMEEALVNFLQDVTSLDGVIELEPMNPYNRLLVHRLADIFGFSHQSVGEGEERHLLLERCPETSIPSILVSDLLGQFDEVQSPMVFDVLRRKEVIQGQKANNPSGTSLEERETAYFAARERIFSADISEAELVKQRPKNNPVVARRMITRALGQTNKATNHELSISDTKAYERTNKDSKIQIMDEGTIDSSNNLDTKLSSDSTSKVPQQRNNLTIKEGKELSKIQENHLREEHMGAAKRLFANALGINRRDVHVSKCQETNKTDGN
ncbi:hypothetical protein ACJIZ3_023142 [Penstemon smallii]|uniref:R3H domain-containing protein n=1 Tax=Penstemon smallii TaxID=265156 RepID=A0ABD3TN93_9LAMI